LESDNIINLDEIRLAKKVAKEVPGAIKERENLLKVLYAYREFYAIILILNQLGESKVMLERQLSACRNILKESGVRSE
jgi:hypothetical protein